MDIEKNKNIELENQEKVNETEFDKLTMKSFINNFVWY